MSTDIRDREASADSAICDTSTNTCHNDGNDGDKRREEIVVATPGSSERPTKKMKRGKYVSKAWYVLPHLLLKVAVRNR